MNAPLVWLPDVFADLVPGLPAGLRYELVSSIDPLPASVAEVELYVVDYELGPGAGEVIASMPRVRVVQTLSAGVDRVRPFVPDGVVLCNGRGVPTSATAEHAVLLALAGLRRLPELLRLQQQETWEELWARGLADRRALVVGYGSIGAAIEARLVPFEVDVVKVARTARDDVHAMEDLPDLLPTADVVILVLPLTGESRGMADAAFLSRMRDGALLVNVGRGGLVDTEALIAECASGRITAALDVTEPEPLPAGHPLWSTPGVIVTPHIAGNSAAYWACARDLLRDQIVRFADGAPLANVMTGEY